MVLICKHKPARALTTISNLKANNKKAWARRMRKKASKLILIMKKT